MFRPKLNKTRITAVVMALVAITAIFGAFSAAFATTGLTTYSLTNLTLTGIFLAVVGLVVVIVAILPIFGSRVRIVVGIIGVVMLLIGVVYFVTPSTPSTQNIVTPAITIESVAGGSYTYTAATHTLVVPVSLNATAKTITSPTGGIVTFSFVVARTDTNTSAAVFALTTSWATLTNSTTGTSSSVVLKASNGTYEVHYGSQWGGNALISVASASSTTVTPTIDISAAAMLDLALYGSTDIGIDVGGQSITVELLVSSG